MNNNSNNSNNVSSSSVQAGSIGIPGIKLLTNNNASPGVTTESSNGRTPNGDGKSLLFCLHSSLSLKFNLKTKCT